MVTNDADRVYNKMRVTKKKYKMKKKYFLSQPLVLFLLKLKMKFKNKDSNNTITMSERIYFTLYVLIQFSYIRIVPI